MRVVRSLFGSRECGVWSQPIQNYVAGAKFDRCYMLYTALPFYMVLPLRAPSAERFRNRLISNPSWPNPTDPNQKPSPSHQVLSSYAWLFPSHLVCTYHIFADSSSRGENIDTMARPNTCQTNWQVSKARLDPFDPPPPSPSPSPPSPPSPSPSPSPKPRS